jgi:hypothetical protein
MGTEQASIVYVKHQAEDAGWPVFCPTEEAADGLVEGWAEKMEQDGVVPSKCLAAWSMVYLYGKTT